MHTIYRVYNCIGLGQILPSFWYLLTLLLTQVSKCSNLLLTWVSCLWCGCYRTYHIPFFSLSPDCLSVFVTAQCPSITRTKIIPPAIILRKKAHSISHIFMQNCQMKHYRFLLHDLQTNTEVVTFLLFFFFPHFLILKPTPCVFL